MYKLEYVGDREAFKQDLMDAGFSELANEAHARIFILIGLYFSFGFAQSRRKHSFESYSQWQNNRI
jgi:hypothetical protein